MLLLLLGCLLVVGALVLVAAAVGLVGRLADDLDLAVLVHAADLGLGHVAAQQLVDDLGHVLVDGQAVAVLELDRDVGDHERHRLAMGDRLGLRTPGQLAYVWIHRFPMFAWDAEGQRWDATHNPFSAPVP